MKRNRKAIVDSLIVIASLVIAGYFLVHIRPDIASQWHCSNAQHCTLTIENRGGGFEQGFNPNDTWHAVNIPAGVHFAIESGVIRAGHSTYVDITIDSGVCPVELQYADTWGESNASLIRQNGGTGQCTVFPLRFL